MNLEELLVTYKETAHPSPKEEKIQKTIQKSKEVFCAAEQTYMLSYYEFLWTQLRVIQKKWWGLQFLLLCMSGVILTSTCEESYIHKSVGIMASLFVILIIPEFWKNRTCQSMEIEEASYYSLRQIYAARMVLFGIVDILLLTAFCGTMTVGVHFDFTELLIQFLLPMIVTACICFGTLCSKRVLDETAAITLCIVWSAIWSLIVLSEKIYTMITLPVLLVVIGCALVFLGITVYRTLNNYNDYWEVNFNGIGTE